MGDGFEHLTYRGPIERVRSTIVDRPYEPELDLGVAPEYQDFTTLLRLKSEVLKSDGSPSSDDDFLAIIIADASRIIEWACRRTFSRARYTEVVVGDGTDRLVPEVTPLARVISITDDDGVAIDLTECDMHPKIGIRSKDSIWFDRTRYTVDYIGGYLLPGAILATASLFVNADPAFETVTNNPYPLNLVSDNDAGLVRSDFVNSSGWTNPLNSGTWKVEDITGVKLTPANSTIVAEGAAATVKYLSLRTLPREIERATIEIAKNIYLSRDRDGMLSEFKKNALSIKWFQEAMPSRSVHWLQGHAKPESPAWRMINAS